MKTESPTSFVRLILGGAIMLIAATHSAAQDARTDSWITAHSGQYARIYATDADRVNDVTQTTWTNGTTSQALPAYVGIQEVYSSANWVYIRSTGLGIHTMGPWYLDRAHLMLFPGWPKNQKALYRIPRSPAIGGTHTLTSLGAIGYSVDGVAIFDAQDGNKWTGSAESVMGTGYWYRDAWVNEGVSFDPGYAHQPGSGQYHYHANPIALRYLLGDHVDFNPATKLYSESTRAVSRHSPILGWMSDGLPVYGPYGYATATNAASGLTRMRSGYVLRNGQNGTQDLTVTGRANLPPWAVRAYGVAANQPGPAVSATYPLGRYMEDNDYLGDLGYTQGVDFDLNEWNARWCVTPEFPNGTWAYFVSITSEGAPAFPYNIGRSFFGTPAGGSVTAIAETVTTNFLGGPNLSPSLSAPVVDNGVVTLVWSAAEGGTYQVESKTDLARTSWATNATGLTAARSMGTYTKNSRESIEFFRVTQTELAGYDPATGGNTGGGGGGGGGGGAIVRVSPASAARGTTVTLTITLPNTAPPQNAPINSVTVGTITGTSNLHVSQTQVTTTLAIPAGASPGPQVVTVVFPGPPQNPGATETFTLSNGFTIE